MKMKLCILFTLSILSYTLLGQNIEITDLIINDLIVCDTGKVKYTFKSSFDDELNNVEVQIALPQGVVYVQGTINGAVEVNTTNPRIPIFEINKLAKGRKVEITVDLALNCEARELIDMSVDFVDTLSVQHNKGSQIYRSSSHDIKTPHLVLTTATPQAVNIAPYQLLVRKHLVINTKRGRLSHFRFIDNHSECNVKSLEGIEVVNTSSKLEIILGGEDFKKIGNQDIYFDTNEELYITEEIIYEKDCETADLTFDVVVDWGCEGDVCQDQTGQLTAEVNELFGEAELELIGTALFPDCPCDLNDAIQTLKITNIGTSVADSVTIEIYAESNNNKMVRPGILDSPFWYSNSKGDSIPVKVIEKEVKICDSIYLSYFLMLPNLDVDEMIELKWYFTWCSTIRGENQHQPYNVQWKAKASFKNICDGSLKKETSKWINDRFPSFKITPFPVSGIINDGDTYPYINEFSSNVFTNYQNGQLTLIYNLPWGFKFGNNDFKIGEVLPEFIDTINHLEIWATYKLPLSMNTIIDTIYAEFDCESPDLDTVDFIGYYRQTTSCPGGNKTIRARSIASFCVTGMYSNCPLETKNDVCGYIGASSTINTEVFCESGDSLEVVIPGYVNFEGNVERTSLGLADEDNDRFADIPNKKASKEDVELKSIMEMDTFKITLKGEIISDLLNVQYDSLFVGFNVNAKLFQSLSNEISIFDKSAGEWYTCYSDNINKETPKGFFWGTTITLAQPTTKGTYIVFHPDYLKTNNCGIPDDFYYEDGDSIIVDLNYIFNSISNYKNGNMETVQAKMFLFSDDYKHYPFTCNSYVDRLKLIKLEYNINSVELANIQACKPSNADHFFKLTPDLKDFRNKPNLFPFEFRSIMRLDSFSLSFDDAVNVDSFVVSYFYKDSFPKFDILIDRVKVKAIKSTNGLWTFEHALSQMYDDDYEIIIEPYISVKNCHDLVHGLANENEIYSIFTQSNTPYFYYDDNDQRRGYYRERKNIKLILQDNYYQLKLGIINTYNQSTDNKGRWKADVILDDSLKFFKFKVINIDSGLCNVRIKDENGNTYLERNGEILVNNYMPKTINNLTIVADNKSCELQHLDIISAWACDTVGDFFGMACAIDTFNLSVKSDTPRLDFAVNLFENPYELCDTLNYIELVITNADKGAAFDLILDMMTSNGFDYLNTKTMYSLDNSTTFTKMPIPKLVNNNHYQWNLTDVIPEFIENGFPGISSNNHVITIRVIGTLDCDFEPGSLFTFEIKGLNNCSKPTNSLKITEVIKIEGVSTNNNTIDIVATANPTNLLCTEHSSISVNFSSTVDFGIDDEINISLPLGMNYVNGSLSAINNFNIIAPNITSKNGVQNLKWKAIEVAIGKDDINFKFDIVAELDALECEVQIIDVKISHESNVFCKTSGDSCFVNLIAGMDAVPITIEKGTIELIDITEFEQLNDTNIYVCFRLLGKLGFLSLWTDSLIFDLYDDHNNDGITSGDHMIGSAKDLVVMHRGDTTIVCLNFVGAIVDTTCHFVIQLSNGNNCICDPVVIKFDQSLASQKKQHVLCPEDKISIGTTQQDGQSYHWTGEDLPCTDCPSFEIIHDFDRDTSFTRTFTFTISDSVDCDYQWIYEITFLPKINIDLIDFELCLGDSIILSLEGFSSVVWSGDGIHEVKGSPVTVSPSESGLFKANWVDLNGCLGEDSFNIVVHNVDTLLYEISNDTTIDLGDEAFLWIKGEGTFEWRPDATLNCSDCSEVIASPSVTTTYNVIITDKNGCQTSKKVTVFLREFPCEPIDVFVPNAFSPNGDLHNDSLFVRGNYFDEMHFMIYDRWGEKVFETTDKKIPWLGEFNNRTLGPDVYSYYLKVRCLNGEYLVKKGNVSIIK